MKTIVLAHYYTPPEVQELADYVGDSLELAQLARDADADRIVFAGVRFMAETAKLLNPEAEVILVDSAASCSLVKETPIEDLLGWLSQYPGYTHVAYINSSIEHKAVTDITVTSRNAEEIISKLISEGKKVIFSPDKNMGRFFNAIHHWNMPIWNATCEVHNKFKVRPKDKLNIALIAHPESPLAVLALADYVGSTKGMLEYVKNYGGNESIMVATEEGILHNMRKLRPDLDIIQAPINKDYQPMRAGKCECNACPYMKLNTAHKVELAIKGLGERIVIDSAMAELAIRPIEAMLNVYN